MIERSNSGQQTQILTTSSDLVPPGSSSIFSHSTQSQVDWQTAMRRAVRSVKTLCQLLNLPLADCYQDDSNFTTFVPLEFLSRIVPGDANDPLLRQVMPVTAESDEYAGFVADPVGDLNALSATGLIQKYHGRALVIASAACAVHCRYCFRRQFPYAEATARRDRWQPAIEQVQSDREIQEIILSGGDPLTLVDENLFDLIHRFAAIEHVHRIRIHTRLPIVIPQRVTQSLCDRLRCVDCTVWFVVHANHANELDDNVLRHLAMLIDSGIPVLNQAVLLKGVNDSEQALVELFLKLVDHRIGPYYLHQLDRVVGTRHFEVPVERGLELMKYVRSRLPGYAVPTYVTEQPGEVSKRPIS